MTAGRVYSVVDYWKTTNGSHKAFWVRGGDFSANCRPITDAIEHRP